MTPRRTATLTARARRRTLRLRLTAWYGGLFLLSGTILLAVTYGLVVQAFAGNTAANAACQAPGTGCHTIGAQQARAIAVHEHAAVLGELLSRSALALALVAVLSAALGWFIAGRALRPLRTITTTARRISAASLNERLVLGGPRDELTELADTFNGLLARLEAAFTAQRQFIANTAHELRTPLARQRVISQVALADPDASIESLRAAHERVLTSGTQQQHLIDALITLARGQAGLDSREPFDLAGLTRKVLADRQPDVQRRSLRLHTTLGPALTAGSPRLAEQLIANLIDNALRHNLPAGQMEVVTRTQNSRAVLAVANTGPHPGNHDQPALPAIPTTHRRTRQPRRRARPGPVHRPSHRRRPRRNHHRPPPARRRPVHRGELPRPPRSQPCPRCSGEPPREDRSCRAAGPDGNRTGRSVSRQPGR